MLVILFGTCLSMTSINWLSLVWAILSSLCGRMFPLLEFAPTFSRPRVWPLKRTSGLPICSDNWRFCLRVWGATGPPLCFSRSSQTPIGIDRDFQFERLICKTIVPDSQLQSKIQMLIYILVIEAGWASQLLSFLSVPLFTLRCTHTFVLALSTNCEFSRYLTQLFLCLFWCSICPILAGRESVTAFARTWAMIIIFQWPRSYEF